MLNLLKNELYKIFHKKSTFIVLIIIILYAFLVNFIYNTEINGGYFYSGYELTADQIAEYQNFIDNFDPNRDSVEDYIYFETQLDINSTMKRYDKDSWQRVIINEEYYSIADSYYRDKYYHYNSDALKAYEEMNRLLENDDWKYFVSKNIEKEKASISVFEETINDKNTSEKDIIVNKASLFAAEERLKNLQYRLDNDLSYGNDYLNSAIEEVDNSAYSVKMYELTDDAKEKKNLEYEVRNFYENKYILDTKENTNDSRTLRSVLMNFFSEYYFLILVFVVMIAGGIVSDEFNKGTIKSLLTTPFSRTKILLSKFLAVLLTIPIVILFSLFVELIIGGIIFGFSSLSIPVVIYNLSTESLEIVGLIKYLALICITTIPKILLLATLAFAVSTIINNTAFAIAITFCGTIATEIINSFALAYNLKFLNYFVTTCWDFGNYLFGGISPYGISLQRAIITCAVYFIIMIVTSFIVFKKKDIKNI